MVDYTEKRIDDMQAAFGGGFIKARAEVGVTSFGMQVIRMPPDFGDYPEHDHTHDGQEEVYVALKGSGWIEIEGERVELAPGMIVRVGSDSKRRVLSGPEGIEMLVVGGRPGEVYEVSELTELTG